MALVPGLEKLAKDRHKSFILMAKLGCRTFFNVKSEDKDNLCPEYNEQFRKIINKLNYPIVILNRYNADLIGTNEDKEYITPYYVSEKYNGNNFYKIAYELGVAMQNTACLIAKTHQVYWVSSIPEIGKNVPETIMKEKFYKGVEQNITITKEEYLSRQYKISPIQQQAKNNCGVHLIDISQALCDEQFCYASKNGEIFYFDDDHLNKYGSDKVAHLFEFLFK